MSAAFFGAFQPTHLQITRGGWRFPSRTSHSSLSSPLASKNRRCSMQLVTLDALTRQLPTCFINQIIASSYSIWGLVGLIGVLRATLRAHPAASRPLLFLCRLLISAGQRQCEV